MAWTPYTDKMTEILKQLPLKEVESADGITVYESDKAEKVVVGSVTVGDELQYGMCTIIPKAEYVLPLFYSRWEERQDSITILVDIMPTVDDLVDEPYRFKYIEPMGESWDRFAKLAGICPEEDDDLRAACSIIYTGAKIPIEKDGMRLAALAPHTDYLKKYVEYMQGAEATGDQVKIKEVQRKIAAIRGIISDFVRRTQADKADQLCNLFL